MSTRPEPRIPYMVKRAEVAIRARLDLICRDYDVTATQYVSLSVLRVHPGMSSAQLAVRSFVTPQSANQMVAALERQGYIERSPDEKNRRILRTSLTAKGRRLLERIDKKAGTFEAQMLSRLSDDEQRELRRLLQSCIESMAEEA
jgi:DNA-binding MarR family transcriptional regulator